MRAGVAAAVFGFGVGAVGLLVSRGKDLGAAHSPVVTVSVAALVAALIVMWMKPPEPPKEGAPPVSWTKRQASPFVVLALLVLVFVVAAGFIRIVRSPLGTSISVKDSWSLQATYVDLNE